MKTTHPYDPFVAKTWISGLLVEKHLKHLVVYCLIHLQKNVFYNQFQNVLKLFDVLPNFPFTSSEMMGDYYL